MNPVEASVAAWHESADRIIALGEHMTDDAWALPTDCPGWSVGDVYAHLAHLEILLTAESHSDDDSDATHAAAPIRSQVLPDFTEPGVREFREQSPEQVRREFSAATTAARTALTAMPADPDQTAPMRPPGTAWSWRTLLQNRAIDLFVHEQDIRRAIGRPGGWDGIAAQFTMSVFAAALPYVVGKRVSPDAGTSAVWSVHGDVAFETGVVMGTDGRARSASPIPPDPTAGMAMDSESFLVLAAGRRSPADVEVELSGDIDLAARLLEAMPITP